MQNRFSDITPDRIIAYLPGTFSGEIIIKETTASTNEDAKRLALSGAKPGTVVIANTQTTGHGRMDRRFYSPADSGLYLSVILPADENLLKITPFAAVSVCKAIEALSDEQPKIKWVNDIILRGKKVCGILCESVPQKNCVIAGIGINYQTAAFPDDISSTAGPLFKENPPDKNNFIGILLRNLFDTRLFSNCIDEYRKRSCVIGKEIRYHETGKWHFAYAETIDENGGLVILEEGVRRTLCSGEITLRCNL